MKCQFPNDDGYVCGKPTTEYKFICSECASVVNAIGERYCDMCGDKTCDTFNDVCTIEDIFKQLPTTEEVYKEVSLMLKIVRIGEKINYEL